MAELLLLAGLYVLFLLAVLVADDAAAHNDSPLFWGAITFHTDFFGAFAYLLQRGSRAELYDVPEDESRDTE